MGKPRNTRHDRKYPKYQEIKRYLEIPDCIFRNSYPRPKLDSLPNILSNTRPDQILKKTYLLGTGSNVSHICP